MNNRELTIFELPTIGRVIADLSNERLMPIVQFADGTACFGLPRSEAECELLGYKSIAEANFIHEAAHLYLSAKCGFIFASVAYRAGKGADFTEKDILEDAKREEMLVLGFQAFVNEVVGDCLTTNKVEGFCLHVVNAAIAYTTCELYTRYGLTIGGLRREFVGYLDKSKFPSRCGCGTDCAPIKSN